MHDNTAQPTEPVSNKTTMKATIPLPMARSLLCAGLTDSACKQVAHSECLADCSCLRSDACGLLLRVRREPARTAPARRLALRW